MDYEDIQINVPWGHIAGRWYGNRNVRPILALHGWQDNLGTWDRLIPLLPNHLGILCVDFPGHGRSSKYPIGIAYHMINYVDTIIRIIEEYKWEKVSLLGHSLGGIVSFLYTSLFPHRVDMLIQLDIVCVPIRNFDYVFRRLETAAEKLFIDNERLEEERIKEPPSFTYEQLEEKLHVGLNYSIEKENCKYLLNRSINMSQMYPEKYYFSRDARLKYYIEFNVEQEFINELVKRLKNVNHMVLKFKSSPYVDYKVIENIRKIHKQMEFYEIEGLHHNHLNNAAKVAEIIIPFILKSMPNTKLHAKIQKNNFSQSKL